MRKFVLSKVIRSELLDRMHEAGTEVFYRRLDPNEAFPELLKKVIEEAQEAMSAPKADRAKELADIQTALKDAISVSGISRAEVDQIKQKTAADRGRFIPTVYVETVNVQDDDPMAEYYGSDPQRFPEIR